jgi:inorganic pyrophosphatase
VYIENTPQSPIKYKVDAATGLLKVDHPLETSALSPEVCGFIPRILCGKNFAPLNSQLRGNQATLDVFVLSERPLLVASVLADLHVIGCILVKDESFVDDKLITVLHRDAVYGGMRDISELPVYVLDRLCHFLTQGSISKHDEIGDPFGKARAGQLLSAGMKDYDHRFGG